MGLKKKTNSNDKSLLKHREKFNLQEKQCGLSLKLCKSIWRIGFNILLVCYVTQRLCWILEIKKWKVQLFSYGITFLVVATK